MTALGLRGYICPTLRWISHANLANDTAFGDRYGSAIELR